ncbi:MAG: DUF362 domain-containing protein [candidate division KSB1 bacterium]|nr:DUF362 domain-containing protein [candidate division KSB1 bacterium]
MRFLSYLDSRLLRRCSKTGRIIGFRYAGAGVFFPILGLLSLIWFLIRVIPKPSRAAYPCMRAAAPLASGFIVYLIGSVTAWLGLRKTKQLRSKRPALAAALSVLVVMAAVSFTVGGKARPAAATIAHEDHKPNAPIGEAKGIFPGRVVWVWDPDATNENCTNSANKDDGWFMPKNNNQEVIDRMLSQAIRGLTGAATDSEAWDKIFRYNNRLQGKGDVGYQEGEIIYIKINATSSWDGNFDPKNLAIKKNNNYGIAETNPHLVLALLRQLVRVAGVNQQDIYIGDPLKHVYKHCFDLWKAEFPDINILDNNSTLNGRIKVVKTTKPFIKYSDRGTVMFTGDWSNPLAGQPTVEDYYCTIAEICNYLINIPTMKGHRRAGVTMFAKNHFGSHMRNNAVHLHNGLVDPTEDGKYARFQRHQYRVQVDLMGHEKHYKRGLFYLMDALYSGSEATDPPRKFSMPPFNNDWTSSIFLSFDPVAIESVGYDFLRTEFHAGSLYPYPVKPAVDDYLHQAADRNEWPTNIIYDPEGDGTPIPSLGVHEHWNNAVEKKYSRNLGIGNGIELYSIFGTTGVAEQKERSSGFSLPANYPNPFNPGTTIRFELPRAAYTRIEIFDMNGRLVLHHEGRYEAGRNEWYWNGMDDQGQAAPSGIYFCRVSCNDGISLLQQTRQMTLVK